jgi:hypothetical protein
MHVVSGNLVEQDSLINDWCRRRCLPSTTIDQYHLQALFGDLAVIGRLHEQLEGSLPTCHRF